MNLGRTAMKASIAVLHMHALSPTRVRERLVTERWAPVWELLDRELTKHPRLVIRAVRWILDTTAFMGARSASYSVQGAQLLARIRRAMDAVYPNRKPGDPDGYNWNRVAAQLRETK